MTRVVCRGCGETNLETVLALGRMPLANALLTERELDKPEARYPLELMFCSRCCLVQIAHSVDPHTLFNEYAYFSSVSTTMLDHAAELVRRMILERNLGPTSLAMEVASNDGYLLQHYVKSGIPVLGIDPAKNIVPVAEAKGVSTMCAFFGLELANELRRSGHRADVLHAHNVLAHVPNLDDFVEGMARVLVDDGIAVIETPYVRELVDRVEFDTIYHEHLFYYSLSSVQTILQRNGLSITNVERVPIHGGSLLIFATPETAGCEASPAVAELLEEEKEAGICNPAYYRGFADRVDGLRMELTSFLAELKSQGRQLAAYGAAAKGTVLLNAFGIGRETLDYVADRSHYKQGRYVPGVKLPVVAPERLLKDMPDYVLLLAWNFAEEIVSQQDEYLRRGGRFVIPVPEMKVT